MQIDLGFGNPIQIIEYAIDLTSNLKGPLFERNIILNCYPIEFIFAEKLETVIFRGKTNTRMKDFHDLYSLISIGNLNAIDVEKAVEFVFELRQTPLSDLPIIFENDSLKQLTKGWQSYLQKRETSFLPTSIEDLIQAINNWLQSNTHLCIPAKTFHS